MTHDVDTSKCAAYGCPCPGTSRSSTSGGNNWLCPHHIGTDAGAWQRITAELNRLSWLVDVCNGIRIFYGTEKWERVYREIQRDIVAHQRSDLLFDKNVDASVTAWRNRLDTEISRAVSQHRQAEIIVAPAPASDPMKRVHLSMPAHA
ncbi:hypothetical protein [Herbaspirillum sp. RV1423]|uniref:hypothetical protein n=1 Tax=Herbaspirillum sp. RV1423 TaxID=1443993 RepID=UPI0004B4E80C|nr:hypothetical protein [Herbaspirillum sp. RV1423]